MDTIFALATARGRSGVAVIRVSGPLAPSVTENLCGDLPPERRAVLRTLRVGDEILDEALVIRFASGRSFTGESVTEFHIHGSPAVIQALLRALGNAKGLRPAEAGEFTWRAFENGRLDLSQVEGLADLLEAETDNQRRQAQKVLSGSVGRMVERWRADLIKALALVEVTIDFADEDVPQDVTSDVLSILRCVRDQLLQEAEGVAAAERLRDGFEVAIVGRPNVGKSSLLNHLARRDVALTSSIAGTTRDVIEVRLDLAGYPVTLLDTAGLRETSDIIEEMGIERARRRAAEADLRVFLVDPGESPDRELFRSGDVVAISKADLRSACGLSISVVTGEGINALLDQLTAQLADREITSGTLTRERHRHSAVKAADGLQGAIEGLVAGQPTELVAVDLRSALTAIESLIGRVDVEELLGSIFSTFCIGK
ncbi:MAG: tRNA uridine-5-carboxymethylaminomethyl(34) synthesis GTPase MnmE [Alkalilacustris sp.]